MSQSQIKAPALSDGRELLAAAATELRPRPRRTVSEWADAERVLTSVSSARPGRWRTSLTPYLRAPMDDMSASSRVQLVVLRFATQIGKSEALFNALGYAMTDEPGPVLLVQPTVDMGKRVSRQRIQPMIDASPALSRIVAAVKSRDSGNTVRMKEFAGGVLLIAGANSRADLRSMPVRYALEDEVSLYPDDLDDEGSIDELVDRRTSSYGRRRKRMRVSSPLIEGACAITEAWLTTDQRWLYVPCPLCGEWQRLEAEQLTHTGEYLCPHCAGVFDEHTGKRLWYDPADPQLEWRAERPERSALRRGYSLASWYAAEGIGYTWREIADMREAARDDPVREKTFTNTIAGLPWDNSENQISVDELLTRREGWQRRQVPPGVLLLTVGIDVQIDRAELSVWGWGENDHAWWIDHQVLPLDPTALSQDQEIDAYLAQSLVNSYGVAMSHEAIGIDSGNWTQEVYTFVRHRPADRWYALKGSSQLARPALNARPTRIDVSVGGVTVRSGLSLWSVGSNTVKGTLLGRLMSDAERDPEARRIHIPADMPDDTLSQLAGETLDPTTGRWLRRRTMRNEALDCWVYAYAVACSPRVRMHTLRAADWQRRREHFEPRTRDLFAAAEPGAEPASEPASEPARDARTTTTSRPPRAAGGFIRRGNFRGLGK